MMKILLTPTYKQILNEYEEQCRLAIRCLNIAHNQIYSATQVLFPPKSVLFLHVKTGKTE